MSPLPKIILLSIIRASGRNSNDFLTGDCSVGSHIFPVPPPKGTTRMDDALRVDDIGLDD